MGVAHGRSGLSGWDVGVGSCGVRCLKLDLRDFLGIFGIRARSGGAVCGDGVWSCVFAVGVVWSRIFGMGVAHGIKEKIGWKDWQDD